MTATLSQMLGELRLNGNERADWIELLERNGKRDPAEIGNKKARLRIYREAVERFAEMAREADHGA